MEVSTIQCDFLINTAVWGAGMGRGRENEMRVQKQRSRLRLNFVLRTMLGIYMDSPTSNHVVSWYYCHYNRFTHEETELREIR